MAGFHRQRKRGRRQSPPSPDAASPPPDAASPPPTEETVPAEPAAGDLVPSPADVAAAHRHRPRGPREAESTTAATADPDDVPATSQRPATSKRSATSQRPAGSGSGGNGDRETERGLRGLVGSGSSQVGVWAAARARDAARPSDEELRRADEELAIVRRNWVPREPFRPGSKP